MSFPRFLILPAVWMVSFCSPLAGGDIESAHSIDGMWKGTMDVYGKEFPITLVFEESSSGTATGYLLSPTHSQGRLPLSRITLKDRDLEFQSELLSGSFSGKLSPGSGRIRGDWKQDGHIGEIEVKFDEGGVAVDRPQNPRGNASYEVREVEFLNKFGPHNLSGTLTLPKRSIGPVPAVILLSGMGPHDRDGTAFGHKPFLVMADYLTEKGYAVLRFDDRGVGRSGGNFDHANTLDFATDAWAAIEFLTGVKEVDPKRIGLLGHGEGAWVASIAATKREDVSFLILLGAPGASGAKTILSQSARIGEAAGLSREFVTVNGQFYEALFDVLSQPVPNIERVAELGTKFEKEVEKLGQGDKDEWEGLEETMLFPLTRLETPWLPWFVRNDPGESLGKLTSPVLVLTGELDREMSPEVHFPGLRKSLRNHPGPVAFEILPGLNHRFQRAETGAPSEYGKIEETFSPRVLGKIENWIDEVVR